MNFETYLRSKNHTEITIDEHINTLESFKRWAKNKQIQEIETLKMNDVLEYVQHLQANENKVGTINNRLNTLKNFFNFQIENGRIVKNPIRNLNIKGSQKTVVQNILDEKSLNELYSNYQNYIDAKPERHNIPKAKQDKTNQRYKLIVSLMIYQGLHTGELDKLKVEDINLSNGTIYIPSTSRSKSRVLPLQPNQLIAFYRYISDKDTESKLFEIKVQKSHSYILSELKGINSLIKNAQQIRASVLINWIKEHGKRKAQYMIGHKYVSTTESYEIQDTSELSELLDKVHLFG